MPTTDPQSIARIAADQSLPSILAVGDWHAREFGEARALVSPQSEWHSASDWPAAFDFLESNSDTPDLIAIAQLQTDAVRQKDVEHFLKLAPLVRIVIVSGTWCEGELRTGNPIPGIVRLYWHEFSPWWQSSLRRIAQGLGPHWSLPCDSPYAGRWSPDDPAPKNLLPENVVIETPDHATFDALRAALQPHGCQTLWHRHGAPTEFLPGKCAGVWDGGQLSDTEFANFQAFAKKIVPHGGPVIALLDFPRAEHIEKLNQTGATAVFAKPYITNELLTALTTLPPSPSPPPPSLTTPPTPSA